MLMTTSSIVFVIGKKEEGLGNARGFANKKKEREKSRGFFKLAIFRPSHAELIL